MDSAVLIGEEGLLALCGDYILERNWQVQAVMTSSVEITSWAAKNKIPVVADYSSLRELLKSPPDYLFSITNFSIIPGDILSWVGRMAINFHDGPLPELAGLNTPSWTILNNNPSHGITWHRITDEIDGGEILLRTDFPVDPSDTVLELNARCFEYGFEGFQQVIDKLETNSLELVPPQHPDQYYLSRQKPPYLGFIDWNQTSETIRNLYRATAYSGYRNGFASLKVFTADSYFIPKEILPATEHFADTSPGTVLKVSAQALTVKTLDSAVDIQVSENQAELLGIQSGQILPDIAQAFPSEFQVHQSGHIYDDMSWARRLTEFEFDTLQHVSSPASQSSFETKDLVSLNAHCPDGAEALAALALLLGRMNGKEQTGIPVSTSRVQTLAGQLHGFFLPYFPASLTIEVESHTLLNECQQRLEWMNECPPICSDLFDRLPALGGQKHNITTPELVYCQLEEQQGIDEVVDIGASYTFYYQPENKSLALRSRAAEAEIEKLDKLLAGALIAIRNKSSLLQASLANDSDLKLLESINQRSSLDYQPATVDSMVRHKVEQSPDDAALHWKGETCSFARLKEKADQITAYLISQNLPDNSLIGVMLEDRIEAVCTMLGILQAGFAYVPLDPTYPTDRLTYIVSDAGVNCVFADPVSSTTHGLQHVSISPTEIPIQEIKPVEPAHTPQHRAYVIYTSGSTGNPKGVQVSHDNVINFMLGMDGVIDTQTGTMLSVTSISFDISVLEIWWSLTRGLRVVFYDEENTLVAQSGSGQTDADIAFSLYFWNTQDPAAPSSVGETYDLLNQAAKFADQNGFEAIWSPERHFGSFGGPFPNPAVTNAALASITQHVKLRAGSCVMPLHHPIRVAEDWAMIDNFSNGRVGVSFASGWMPQDFAIAPQNFANAKDVMLQGIDQVRSLWRGEAVSFPGPDGEVSIKTLPRPVQPELPCWLTTAGSPATFAEAGKRGLNVLTHLLGQSADDLTEKIKVYRDAWSQAGHPGDGCVTLMLHTFVTTSRSHAENVSRAPMKAYLKSAMSLVKAAAWEFPTFKKMESREKADMDEYFDNLTEQDLDDLLEFAFQRYFRESGLFGTPEDNIAFVNHLKSIGVNEIGCLVDFGIQPTEVLANLTHLDSLKRLTGNTASNSLTDIAEHFSVTHMQCTPSQANMFSLDNANLAGMEKLQYLLVGGEALSQNLADRLTDLVSGKVINMYGPTETTVWSLTSEVKHKHKVQIGQPIANTTVHILDPRHRSVPLGWSGELYIGGRGVSMGYLERPELNQQRFIELNGETIYATGDTVRMCDDGNVEFLGRNDHQVKIRGYRIELGEIEAELEKVNGIEEAVVVGEQDQWDELQLIAYYTVKSAVDVSMIRNQLKRFLPSYMIPSRLNQISKMPRTLNGKVDRKSLKKQVQETKVVVPPRPVQTQPGLHSDTQKELLKIWQDLLEVQDIDVNANFFDIGGHSILAVRLQGILSKKYARRVPISELFRYPTISGLAGFLEASSDGSPAAETKRTSFTSEAVSRAARRRARYNKS